MFKKILLIHKLQIKKKNQQDLANTDMDQKRIFLQQSLADKVNKESGILRL